MPTPRALDLTGYKLTFDDEFNSFSSNGPSNYQMRTHTGTWDTTLSYGERKLNDEVEQYSDPTIGVDPEHVAGGVLDIHAAPSADPAKTWGQTYTSGVITTYHSFAQEYGYFEMRAELPAGNGFWPAFWLLPQDHVWPPELDVLEAFGAPGTGGDGGAYQVHEGVLTKAPGAQGDWHPTGGANLYTQYNTFGVDWEPDTITFYFDDAAYLTVPTPADFHQKMYMIANLAVGGHWAGAPLGQTGDMKIDYIRAFSKDGGNPAVAAQAVSSPDGRGHTMDGAMDANGRGAQGTDLPPPAPTEAPVPVAPRGGQFVGAGPDDLTLQMSEDAYQGDAQFVVFVDGREVGGTLATGASHAAGATQAFHVRGAFGGGVHRVGVYFTNNFGSAPGADRNLFLSGATIDGRAVPGAAFGEWKGGEEDFRFVGPGALPAPPAPVAIGAGRDTLALSLSEDAYLGDAQCTITVDGHAMGGTLTVRAQHLAAQSQTVLVRGDFAPGGHTVSVTFLNDAYVDATMDRNLYVDRATIDGTLVDGTAIALMTPGPQSLHFVVAAAKPGPVPSILNLWGLTHPGAAAPTAPAATPHAHSLMPQALPGAGAWVTVGAAAVLPPLHV